MKFPNSLAWCLIALALCCGEPALAADSAPAERSNARFDWKAAQPVLIVAHVSVGGNLPTIEVDCPKDRVCISMDAPPYWLQFDQASSLYGTQVPSRFSVNALDHYGSGQYAGREGPFLVLLLEHNGKYAKQRSAHARLIKGNNGTLYLVRGVGRPPSFLPCKVDDIREPIGDKDFDDGILIERGDFAEMSPQSREAYRLTAKGALPRYAISLPRLREYIDTMVRARLPVTCP